MADIYTINRNNIGQVLAKLTLGFKNAAYVGDNLFPEVPVPAMSGSIPIDDSQDFIVIDGEQDIRARGKQVLISNEYAEYVLSQFIYESQKTDHEIDDMRAFGQTDIAGGGGFFFDFERRLVTKMANAAALQRELAQGTLASDTGNYPAAHVITPTDDWADQATVVPADFAIAQDTMLEVVGVYANRALISHDVFSVLKTHESIREYLKYTTPGMTTLQALAQMMEVEQLFVGAARYRLDAIADTIPIWDNTCIFFYQPAAQGTTEPEPRYGATLRYQGYPKTFAEHQFPNYFKWALIDLYGVKLMPAPAGVIFDEPIEPQM